MNMMLSEAVYSLVCIPQLPDMFIYLHGFNSSGDSAKGKFFAQALAPLAVHTPSYPPAPDAAIHILQYELKKHLATIANDTITLIGSSLGGFYAQYLAQQYHLAVVLINPALQPELSLQPYLGWQTNYYTGERYFFGEDELQRLQRYNVPDPCNNMVPTLVLLDAGDEVIDYHVAQQRYCDCARVIVFPDGNHQFQHLTDAVVAINEFHNEKVRSNPQI